MPWLTNIGSNQFLGGLQPIRSVTSAIGSAWRFVRDAFGSSITALAAATIGISHGNHNRQLSLGEARIITRFADHLRTVKTVRENDLRSVMSKGEAKPSSKTFRISYLNLEKDRDRLCQHLDAWAQFLEAIPESNNDLDEAIIQNSHEVIMTIKDDCLTDQYRFLVAEDSCGEIQAIAVCTIKINSPEGKMCKLNWLATAPHNLDIQYNEGNKQRIRGAGSAIVHHLTRTALLYRIPEIKLVAFEQALSFYRSLGFEPSAHDKLYDQLSLSKVRMKTLAANSSCSEHRSMPATAG